MYEGVRKRRPTVCYRVKMLCCQVNRVRPRGVIPRDETQITVDGGILVVL